MKNRWNKKSFWMLLTGEWTKDKRKMILDSDQSTVLFFCSGNTSKIII